jgi:MFS family permease
MKIDLAGPRQRGLAMGLNEFAGYLAVAVAALATGLVAARFGLRPEPFYLGIGVVTAGLALVLAFVRDTKPHADLESLGFARASAHAPRGRAVFTHVSWRDPALSSASQAGLVNNLNDGLAWGLFPLFFAAAGLSVSEIGTLAFVYPATWGILQLVTGPLSDRWGRKGLIVLGMVVQGVALAAVALTSGFTGWLAASALLGVGTAMVYPTLLASIGDVADPIWRGSAIGVYRLWRDAGYVVGAVLAGTAADRLGMSAAILIIAVLTVASGVLVAARMPETLRSPSGALR